MKFFLAGIMQGSLAGADLHDQDYRVRLRALLERHFPAAEVYDPLADHGNSLAYDDQTARAVFYRHNRLCRQVDVVVAFVPQASMGTAIEMWEAHEHGRGVVVTVSPLAHNWAVRFCSHAVYEHLEALEVALETGQLQALIQHELQAKARQREICT